jgi:Transmembrane family, TMEM144 of transporters
MSFPIFISPSVTYSTHSEQGSLVFQEPTKNVPMAVSAIILLVIGVYAVSTSQSKVEVEAEVVLVGCDGSAIFAEAEKEFVTTVDGESGAVSNQTAEKSATNDNSDTTSSSSGEGGGNLDRNCTEILQYSDTSHYSVHVNPLVNHQTKNTGDLEAGINRNTAKKGVVSGDEECQKDFKDQGSPVKDSSPTDSDHCKAFYGQIIGTRICNTNASTGESKSKIMISLDHLKSTFGAYLLCFFVGFCDGTLLVPFKLGNIGENNIFSVFRYLASFGISSLMVSPFLFLFYCLILNGRKIPCFHVRVAFIPGVSSGILWAAANFLSVHATYYLGNYA